jgi:hypothetical protein
LLALLVRVLVIGLLAGIVGGSLEA